MWWLLSTVGLLFLYAVVRLLNLASPSLPPSIYVKTRQSHFVQALLASCPILREPYVPPLLWGKSGHIQTVVYAKLGRMRDPAPSGSRHTKTLHDGSTLTFDLYRPTASTPFSGTYCMLVCPGIGSSSESSYIRALVTNAQSSGYHVAVLNHLGCLHSLRLTAPRIFSYGGWEEFDIMRREVEKLYPHCKFVMVGLSMGANILLRYLGEQRHHQQNVSCAFSICQGYNINSAKMLLKQWQNFRRAYLYTMTANQRRLIKRHSHMFFSDHARQSFDFDLAKVFNATTLEDLDLHFSCKLQGYTDVVQYYESHSCSNYIRNIDVPLIMLNAEDDPIVPESLFKYPRDYTETHDHAVFITTRHGGHLGYFESGLLRPDPTSWMDRFICQLTEGVIGYTLQRAIDRLKPSAGLDILKDKETDCQTSSTSKKTSDLSTGEGTSLDFLHSQSKSSLAIEHSQSKSSQDIEQSQSKSSQDIEHSKSKLSQDIEQSPSKHRSSHSDENHLIGCQGNGHLSSFSSSSFNHQKSDDKIRVSLNGGAGYLQAVSSNEIIS